MLSLLGLMIFVHQITLRVMSPIHQRGHFGMAALGVFDLLFALAIAVLLFVPVENWIHRFVRFLCEKMLLVVVAIAVMFALIEGALRTGLFDDLSNPHPVWIPRKYRDLNDIQVRANYLHTDSLPYHFNDIPRTYERPDSVKLRIAFLGDSFVWGTGLSWDSTWTHKIDRYIHGRKDSIEILNWGRSGWSTKDELIWLEDEGFKYKPDLLIVGFVTNDPDMGDIPQRYAQWHKAFLFRSFGFLLPSCYDFITSYINNIYANRFNHDLGYGAWEAKLYSDSNLVTYSGLLNEFASYCEEKNIPLVFMLSVMRPDEKDYREYREKFDKIRAILNAEEITYIDPSTEITRTLAGWNARKLWANPADGHPGTPVTDIYVRVVYQWLSNHHWLFRMNEVIHAHNRTNDH